jgi:NAD(P)-dependent dehydrogenase (short-subunit alcohol dehydrogenase family)
MLKSQVALITGVSSGIGREIALMLAPRCARVFGTVRQEHPEETLPGIELLRLDVTSDESVAQAVQSVLQKAGAIHILVNNAGYALAGAIEETSVEEAREQFETNFFGVMRVTQAVLPGMRRQRYGRIVNISSMAGLIALPYRGIYSASKHALEGYTETLDHEVRQFGIRAVLIEPVFTRTKVETNRRSVHSPMDIYADQERRINQVLEEKIAHGDQPRAVAEAVCAAVESEHPHLRYPIGRGRGLSRMRRFIPEAMFDRQFRKQFHLDQAPA